MRRMWFGLEIDVVGHPPLGRVEYLYTKEHAVENIAYFS